MAETTESDRRRRLLWFSIAVNCGLLGLFKYWEFALSGVAAIVTALGLPFDAPSHTVALPPGLSYFTFTSIAYVVDVYHRRLPASRTFVQHALFISFFPKLLAGPIVRAGHLLPQLDRRISAKLADIEVGLTYVLVGAVKKLVVSDQIAGHVNLVFESPTAYDRFTLIQVLLGYAIQIYCDFAAYSDLAVGFA